MEKIKLNEFLSNIDNASIFDNLTIESILDFLKTYSNENISEDNLKEEFLNSIFMKDLLCYYIKNFLGYGNIKNPKYIFLGMEEGGGLIFSRLRAIKKITEGKLENGGFSVDMKEFHNLIPEYKDIFKKEKQATWEGVIKLLNYIEKEDNKDNKDNEDNKDDKFSFKDLGKIDGEVLFTEIFPLPVYSNTNKAFKEEYIENEYLTSLIGKKLGIANRKDYEDKFLEIRLEKIKEILKNNKDAKIIIYGKKYWEKVKEYFGIKKVDIKNIEGKEIEYFEIKNIEGKEIEFLKNFYFIYHFTNGQSPEKYLEELGKFIKEKK